MSHTEHCIFCYDAVLDVDDGERVLKPHIIFSQRYVCIKCLDSAYSYRMSYLIQMGDKV